MRILIRIEYGLWISVSNLFFLFYKKVYNSLWETFFEIWDSSRVLHLPESNIATLRASCTVGYSLIPWHILIPIERNYIRFKTVLFTSINWSPLVQSLGYALIFFPCRWITSIVRSEIIWSTVNMQQAHWLLSSTIFCIVIWCTTEHCNCRNLVWLIACNFVWQETTISMANYVNSWSVQVSNPCHLINQFTYVSTVILANI
jgi:hypothetical protein